MNKKTATMLYDGKCQFCLRAVNKWQKRTGAVITYEPYQKSLSKFPQITKEACEKAVQLMTPDGTVYSGAHAVFKAFDLSGNYSILHALYQTLPLFGKISEAVYSWVAKNRHLP